MPQKLHNVAAGILVEKIFNELDTHIESLGEILNHSLLFINVQFIKLGEEVVQPVLLGICHLLSNCSSFTCSRCGRGFDSLNEIEEIEHKARKDKLLLNFVQRATIEVCEKSDERSRDSSFYVRIFKLGNAFEEGLYHQLDHVEAEAWFEDQQDVHALLSRRGTVEGQGLASSSAAGIRCDGRVPARKISFIPTPLNLFASGKDCEPGLVSVFSIGLCPGDILVGERVLQLRRTIQGHKRQTDCLIHQLFFQKRVQDAVSEKG
mmetsp:Transcript_894/g.1993  ORF Transcript_894/g.1993 Transcript_894/m.1993 type:complete len:263 (+) Transcript_894:680-1468(+)